MDISDKQTGVEVELIGTDGNVFSLMSTCTREMKRAGFGDAARELQQEVMDAGSYDEALRIMMSYCEVR